ncbi:MAG: ABC transporter permease [Bacteroidetes bacterium]|jgi:putative ABC transport system permease protein|nr:ABC transporter permease [Bacteroidota bacterium]
MIQKSIKIALHRLMTSWAYSSINIGGLAVAVSVCLAIFFYVYYHLSFDKHIPDGENTYRLITRYGQGSYSTNTFACFDEVLSALPQVLSHTSCYDNHRIDEVFAGAIKIKVNNAIFAKPSFLDFFGIKMIRGEKNSLDRPNAMLVTPGLAKKLFPDSDPIGQTVMMRSFTANRDSLISFNITGIVEPLPENSHLRYEMLLSQKGHFGPTVETLKSRKVFGGLIYLKLFPSTNISELETSFQAKLTPYLEGVHGPPLDATNHKLQAVYDIHFTPGLNNEAQPTIRRSSLHILLLVGLIMLTIAIMNSVIIHIARINFNRIPTLIIRFHGGTKLHLFVQTFIEVFISAAIAFAIAIFLLFVFNDTLAHKLFANWIISFQDSTFLIFVFSLFVVVTLLISMMSSSYLLKNETILKEATRPKGIKFAVPLVVFQFVMVIGLVAFALLINKQMNFVAEKDLGYTSENVLVIKVPQQNEKIYNFRAELLNLPGIINAGTAHHYPGYRLQDMNFTSGGYTFPFKFGFLDTDATETLNTGIVEYFAASGRDATDGWLINKTFYDHLRERFTHEQIATGNFPVDESADGEGFSRFVVLGVMKDFHYASLHSEIENFAFFIPRPEDRFNRFMLVRIQQGNSGEVINSIEEKMAAIYPGQLFSYSFLQTELNQEYASEKTLLKLINIFSVLAIFIAGMGLVGLSIFMTEKRTKEIGIRKVNGASVHEIMQMLNLVFIRWVGIAFLIATPISWYVAEIWLQNFAYKTRLSWWIFVLSGIITLCIVIITVSWQTFKVARRNPVEALRYE